MGFVALVSWLILIGVAGLSVIVGVVYLAKMWPIRPTGEIAIADKRAMRGRYTFTAAVAVVCCELCLELLMPDKIRMRWLWGVPMVHLVPAIGFWTAFGVLITARVTVGEAATALGREVSFACWALLGISGIGGALFLANQHRYLR